MSDCQEARGAAGRAYRGNDRRQDLLKSHDLAMIETPDARAYLVDAALRNCWNGMLQGYVAQASQTLETKAHGCVSGHLHVTTLRL
jgi:hypothetical protein